MVTTPTWSPPRVAGAVIWGAAVLVVPSDPEPAPELDPALEPELGWAPIPAVCAGAGVAVGVTSYTLVLATRVSVVTEVVYCSLMQCIVLKIIDLCFQGHSE